MQEDELLLSIQRIELQILDVFHDFCNKRGLRYSLAYGTLLGAIRNNGMIPWDDDIDVMMQRADYDRFISEWKQNPPNGYILQTEYDNEIDYPNNFSKIRKDHTAFIQLEEEKNRSYHKGIFIDVFPVDHVASNSFGRRLQFLNQMIYMLYCRQYTDNSRGIIGVIERIMLHIPFRVQLIIKHTSLKHMVRWNNMRDCLFVIPCTVKFCKKYYPADLFDEFVLTDFNGRQYYRTKNYEGFLETMYGDYMRLPPVEERVWKHHPILIDFENNYEKQIEKELAK